MLSFKEVGKRYVKREICGPGRSGPYAAGARGLFRARRSKRAGVWENAGVPRPPKGGKMEKGAAQREKTPPLRGCGKGETPAIPTNGVLKTQR